MSLALSALDPLPGLKGGVALVGIWLILAAAAGFLSPYDPGAQDLVRLLQPPDAIHWLGTDRLGRDVLSRIIFGVRIDLALCVLGAFAPFVIGCLLGMLAGAAGGIAGAVLDRIIDVLDAFPRIVIVLAVMGVLGGDLRSFYLALALVGWTGYAGATRQEWRRMRRSAFVAAARGLGIGWLRIHLRHILPNTLTPAVARAPGEVVRILLMALALGYFGIGVPTDSPEWGASIAAGQSQMVLAWWLPLFPGIAALSLTLGLNRLADGVVARLGAQLGTRG